MTNPVISVIMPVYNTKQWVGEAIESILNQTFKEFEFIIVDDCSTDGSYEICEKYAKKDKRIKLYRNEKNGGVAYTKNRLIGLTSTNYLASQDSDDVSFLDRLEFEYKFLEDHKEYAVVSGNNVIIDENGKIIGHREYSDNIKNVILKKSPVSHPTTMIRKDVFEKVGGYSQVKYVEDYDLWIKLYSQGYKIKNINKDLLKYRIRKGAEKSNIKGTLRATINLQEKTFKKIHPSFSDLIYHFCLKSLIILPNKWIMALFKLLTY